jgi:hypothetical protein
MAVRVGLNLQMDLVIERCSPFALVCVSLQGGHATPFFLSEKDEPCTQRRVTCMLIVGKAAIASIRLGKYRNKILRSSKRSEHYHELCCKFEATKKHSGVASPSQTHPTPLCVLAGWSPFLPTQ